MTAANEYYLNVKGGCILIKTTNIYLENPNAKKRYESLSFLQQTALSDRLKIVIRLSITSHTETSSSFSSMNLYSKNALVIGNLSSFFYL